MIRRTFIASLLALPMLPFFLYRWAKNTHKRAYKKGELVSLMLNSKGEWETL